MREGQWAALIDRTVFKLAELLEGNLGIALRGRAEERGAAAALWREARWGRRCTRRTYFNHLMKKAATMGYFS